MPEQGTLITKWRFAFSILLPVALVVTAIFGLVVGLIYWSTSQSDEQALKRQINLVGNLLDQQRADLTAEQSEVTAWDDALEAVAINLDPQWISTNLGNGLNESYGHDRAFLLDPELKSLFAMADGTTRNPRTFENFADILLPLAVRLHQPDSLQALVRYSSGADDTIPSVTDVVTLDGQPAYVSAMPIASDHNYLTLNDRPFIHISVQYIDAELAHTLGALLMLDQARFDAGGEDIRSWEVKLPIYNQAGNPVSHFIWTPDRPGTSVLYRTLPAIVLAMIAITLVISFLVYRLRRSNLQLAEGRSAAQHLAFHDRLTDLANRALFEERLNTAIARANQGGNQVALLLLDLDRFKQVNDTLGHEAGDQLIVQVANRLRPLLGAQDTFARLGGDEFAIIQPGVKSIADAAATSSRIISEIRRPFEVANSQAFVGVSIGIATAPGMASGTAELTRKADIALYEAKAGGRNQHRVFEDRMSESVERRRRIEADLREALVTGEGIDVEYHPLVRDDGTVLVGVEAAFVWDHPEFGRVPAQSYLPVAESCGLIEGLGDFVLQRACETGATTPGQRMAARVYSAQLRNPMFFNRVFNMLGETGMSPDDLELEICESMLTDADPVTASALRKFRNAGINIALADFGTGFTSLRLLQQFQVDRIKIDRSFMAQLAESPDPEAITHAVVWLARAIGVEVSADGVDTLEQKKFLVRMGCMSFQGELFSPQGQANWLREATHADRTQPRTPPQDDIELWDIA